MYFCRMSPQLHLGKAWSLVTHTGIQGWAREYCVLDARPIPKVTPATTFCSKYNDASVFVHGSCASLVSCKWAFRVYEVTLYRFWHHLPSPWLQATWKSEENPDSVLWPQMPTVIWPLPLSPSSPLTSLLLTGQPRADPLSAPPTGANAAGPSALSPSASDLIPPALECPPARLTQILSRWSLCQQPSISFTVLSLCVPFVLLPGCFFVTPQAARSPFPTVASHG